MMGGMHMHSLVWTEYAVANVCTSTSILVAREASLFVAGLCCRTGARLSTDSLKCEEDAICKQQQHKSSAQQHMPTT